MKSLGSWANQDKSNELTSATFNFKQHFLQQFKQSSQGNTNPPMVPSYSTLGRFCILSCTMSFNRFCNADRVAVLGTKLALGG